MDKVNQSLWKRVGECVIRGENEQRKSGIWKMEWNKEHNDLIKQDNGRIYIIEKTNNDASNSSILKIGKSECRGGMKNTFAFYQSGLGGSPSIRTFGIHHLIANELKNGFKVYIWGIWANPVLATIPGLKSTQEVWVHPSIHSMEDICRKDYVDEFGILPPWNFREAGTPWPDWVQIAYSQQVAGRNSVQNATKNENIEQKNEQKNEQTELTSFNENDVIYTTLG